MPLFRPSTDRIGYAVAETTVDCAGCPDAWFLSGFGEEDVQGVFVRMPTGELVWAPITAMEAYETFAEEDVYEVGRDGYYLTMQQARDTLDRDLVGEVVYCDDYNDEWSDFYICDPASLPHNQPNAIANAGEPIR